MSKVKRLADQLWDAIPQYGNPENTITLPAPLVLEILQLLRGMSGGLMCGPDCPSHGWSKYSQPGGP